MSVDWDAHQDLFAADFEVEGRLGRCKVCTQGGASWTKLGNLRAHEKLKVHKENVAQALLRMNQVPGGSGSSRPRAQQAYVEDCTDDDPPPQMSIPWFASPTLEDTSFPTLSSSPILPESSGYAHHLSLDMQDALTGAVDFSSAVHLAAPRGASEITIEDVLSGAGLLDIVMEVEDEESPPAPSVEDLGWAADNEGGTPGMSLTLLYVSSLLMPI